MRLKRLELQGFKSFLDRTILSFEPGITGVVGPNGCGKSNIVDAILWVMGEQSPKHLRGKSMSDVIFNGSDSKAPTSMAEVSLVLESQGVDLPPHLMSYIRGNEIVITRRLYRDGTAEYLLNKAACRLKDVHEVFMDSGVGRRAYSIIEQGQIDRMINVKPEDRRGILEEVAGITKYRAKKKEAERKLEQTRLNLSRVDDIIAELEKQMRSLKIQSTRARKYKEIKTELETVDLYVLGRNLYDLKKKITDFESEKQQNVESRAELDAKVSQFDAELTQLDVQRIDQEKKIESLDNQEREMATHGQRLESQVALLEEQEKHLNQSQIALGQEFDEIVKALELLAEEKASILEEVTQLEDALSALESDIQNRELELGRLQEQEESLQSEKDDISKQLSESSHRVVYLQNQIQHGEQKKEEFKSSLEGINNKLTETVVLLDSLKEKLTEVEQKIQACAEKSQRVEGEVAQAHSECQQISQQLSEAEDQLFQAREKFHSKRSRLESLQELQENLEGYSPTAKEVLGRLEDSDIQSIPLAEVLRPEVEVEDHLEALLGDAMNTLLVRTNEDAKRLAELIHEKELERVGVLSMEDAAKSDAGSSFDPMISAQSLRSKIRVESGYESVADYWVRHVYLCENTWQLFELRKNHPQASFLTQDGRVIAHRGGFLSCGAPPTKTGIFARKREIEELTEVCQGLENDVNAKMQARESLLARLEAQEKLHSELKETLSSIHIESVEFRKEKEKVQASLDRADKDYSALVEQSEKYNLELSQVVENLQTWGSELEAVEQKKSDIQNSLERLEQESQIIAEQMESETEGLSEKRVERSKFSERSQGLKDKRQKVDSEINEREGRKQANEERKSREREQLEGLKSQKEQVVQEQQDTVEKRNRLLAELADEKQAHLETSSRLNEVRIQKDQIHKDREQLLEAIQELEVSLAQAQSDFEHQRNMTMERYQKEATPIGPDSADANIDIETLPLFKSQYKVDWETLSAADKMSMLDEHIVNLRKKVERYGEVNLTAINEYEEVQKRQVFLTEQKEDLEKSIKILEDAIKRIDETTKTRFAETFQGVNEKFQEVFPILFNGGKASLSLTDPDNVLESGVDILVQPPGKRLQSISLLSGGEKALTAVSLILAIFARKPSPFCLLDEVDAPLDDANVSRFNTVVQHMAKKSQFILVTHNRRTMEMADALYGVTMERAGISKMTSVRLH